MDIFEFHNKMKQHCQSVKGVCSECCFLEYCYSKKRDIQKDFIEDIIGQLLKNADENKDKSFQVIRNRYNSI